MIPAMQKHFNSLSPPQREQTLEVVEELTGTDAGITLQTPGLPFLRRNRQYLGREDHLAQEALRDNVIYLVNRTLPQESPFVHWPYSHTGLIIYSMAENGYLDDEDVPNTDQDEPPIRLFTNRLGDVESLNPELFDIYDFLTADRRVLVSDRPTFP